METAATAAATAASGRVTAPRTMMWISPGSAEIQIATSRQLELAGSLSPPAHDIAHA